MWWSISDEVRDMEQHPSSEMTEAYHIPLKATDWSYSAFLSVLAGIIQTVARWTSFMCMSVFNWREETPLKCSLFRTAIQSEQVSLMPRRSNSDDFRNTAAGINLALHNKNENFIAAEQLSVLYLLCVDIKHQRRNIQYGLNFFYCYSWCQLLSKIEIFS